MLVLNRKIGERIKVGDDITLTVIAIDRFGARLGLDAPRGVTILRGELVEAEGERSCLLTLGGENAAAIAAVLTSLELDFELVDPPEMSAGLKEAAARLLAGAGSRKPPARSKRSRS